MFLITNFNLLSIKVFVILMLSMSTNKLFSQNNTYKNAISRFIGEHRYDIEKPGALNGIPAPDFIATTLNGDSVQLLKYSGKVVVLNFWFIACPPCRIDVTPLNELVKHYEGKDVVFLSVAREQEDDLRKHLISNPFAFEVIADPQLAIIRDTYQLFGYPTTIFIDKKGKIRYYTLGGKINEQAVRNEFNQHLLPVIDAALQ